MALTVGTDSYISLTGASDYITLMGLDALVDGENSLKRATIALDRLYGARYIGIKSTLEQALHWPRRPSSAQVDSSQDWYVLDSFGNYRNFNGIPVEVAQATAELAVMIEAGANLYAQPEPLMSQETVKLDVLQTSRVFQNTGYRTDQFYKITSILAPLLSTGSTIKLVR